MTHVAIIVPGIMGSELVLNNDVIWPGPVRSLVFPYGKMNKLLSPAVKATQIIRSFSISEQYDALLRDLRVFGFQEGKTLYLCPYDWRKSNIISAGELEKKVAQAYAEHGADTEISIIAHSMGGLISRYYLESGKYTDSPGFRAIRRLITLGTPHRGAPLALSAALGNEKRLFLNKDQVRQIASDPRYPSLYELLPLPDEPFAWDGQADAAYRPIDLYDATVAGQLGLVQDNLNAARSFRDGLDLANRPQQVRYFFFVGSQQTTMTSVFVDTRLARPVTPVEAEGGGDGTVPIWSAMATGVQARPVGGEHGTIYKNYELRQTLGVLLGYSGVLAAAEGVEVSVREPVTEPEEIVHVALTISAGATDLSGELRLEQAELDDQGKVTRYQRRVGAYPVRYTGVAAEKLSITFQAPEFTGIYRLGFFDEPGNMLGHDDLFVQEPIQYPQRGSRPASP